MGRLQKRSTQKIGAGGVSSQWEGGHTRFEGSKKWHCGNGGKVSEEWSKHFGSHGKARKAIYQESLDKNFCIVGAPEGGARWRNQLQPFMNRARRGDTVYLHCSYLPTGRSVTHTGIFTGEFVREDVLCGMDVTSTWAICVDEWIPISQPFKGGGRQATIYEVTDHENYN
jgi:hypothetical protein